MYRRLSVAAAVGVTVAVVGSLAAGPPAMAVTRQTTSPTSLTTTADDTWWGTNGRVTDTKLVGSRVYLAGAFDYIGPQTGSGVSVDVASGQRSATTPKMDGTVTASAPDGSGGWYIVGTFTHVGDTFRRGAARIDANGNVTKWDPSPKGTPDALAVLADKIIIGGNITAIGSANAGVADLVAVDTNKGQPVPGWSAGTNGQVNALLSTPQGLLVGGSFSTVSGTPANGLVRLAATDGTLDTSFTARVSGSVSALAMSTDGATLVAGGAFSQVSGAGNSVNRANLAGFSTATGAPTGWSVNTNGAVSTLATDAVTGWIYAGGQFTTLAGAARVALGAIGADGTLKSFDPSLSGCNAPHRTKNTYTMAPCSTEVTALSVGNGVVYAGGRFSRTGTTVRHDAAAFASGSSTPTAWNPVASGPALTIGVSPSALFVGGDLTSVNGLVRQGLAALDATTGVGDPTFQVDADNIVLDIEPSTDQTRLYVTGSFSTLGGLDRKDIAAVDIPSGVVDPTFKAQANNTAITARYAAGYLYVGGVFKRVNNVPRSHLVKLNATTGAVDPTFVVNTTGPAGPLRRDGMVQGLAVRSDATRVYLAGPFTSANGVAVTGGILVVNGTTGARTATQLGGVKTCGQGNGPWINYLALSADQSSLYGGDICPDDIYKWDAVNLGTTSNPTGLQWMTWCNAGMQALAEVNGRLYYGSHGGNTNQGGYCWTSPGNHTQVPRQRLTSFDAATGTVTNDIYFFDSPMGVWTLEVVPQGLLVGGDFTLVGDRNSLHQGLALLQGTP